jgi:hypothetical protein
VVVRFPAGPRVRLKTADPPKGNGLGQKKEHLKKKPEIYLLEQSKTKQRMDPARARLPSEHTSIFLQWSDNMALLFQEAYDAAKVHATRSKGTAGQESAGYRPNPRDLPTVPPELTSELLHCLSTLPDPWPLAKVTINMDSTSQWVSKMGRLFFADEYVRHTVGTYTAKQLPQLETAFQAVQDVLADFETRVIEFLSE